MNYKRDPSFNSNSTSLKLTFKPKSKDDTSGSRIIELNNLQNYVGDISKHVLICPKSSELHDNQSPIKLLGEVKRQGLHSVVAAECQGCHKVFHLGGSSKLPVNESFHYDINVRAVWGEMSTGGGVSHLNESLATMGFPGMTQTTFTSIEDQISKWWKYGGFGAQSIGAPIGALIDMHILRIYVYIDYICTIYVCIVV